MPNLENGDDFFFVEESDPEKIKDVILHLVSQEIPKKFELNSIRDIQVLSPMRNGITGVNNLNSELQKLLNPNSNFVESVRYGESIFYIGDKVMQLVNNYDKNVFNGDIGYIYSVDADNNTLTILFANYEINEVEYKVSELDQITLAYASTIHKAQGSEFQAVIMPVSTQHYIMLQKNLLYTGITRGKDLVVLIGQKEALEIAVRNNKAEKRLTNLMNALNSN